MFANKKPARLKGPTIEYETIKEKFICETTRIKRKPSNFN